MMLRKSIFFSTILASLLPFGFRPAAAQSPNPHIPGFQYEHTLAPSGHEWESPQLLALNKELPHASFFSFKNVESARKVLPEHSDFWLSLNGNWKFHWVKTPEERPKDFFDPRYDVTAWESVPVPMSWNIFGIQKDGSLKYGVPIYTNQRVIFHHQVKTDDWRGGVMRTPAKDWTTYVYRNEVGSYRRNFTVPATWDGREVFINFDGVDSFFYLWINGKYVGFSKNSRNVASFNITTFLKPGAENVLAVEVYRNSDASFLEDQDMFRLPGIFRDVALTSTPKIQIQDLAAIPELDSNYVDGTLKIRTNVRNLSGKKAAGYKIAYSLYQNELYSDQNTLVDRAETIAAVPELDAKTTHTIGAILAVKHPNKWSAELPHRYTLVAELKDRKNRTVEVVSTYVGFRKVEIKDTKASDDEFGLAGRYFYVNGKTVKLKGVNRHETNPKHGKVVTREQMEAEVRLMKRANINHVRNSHYPEPAYWYYLCDKYGIYLEDEANIESHQYYYGKESLSHVPEWKAAHVARNIEMVRATINHPSVVIWSLGNEAGPGNNFVAAYEAIKKIDTSRPVQYERNNAIVDIGSNQYPSIDWVRGAVKGTYKLKYPFHISEYAHSMGNAAGNLIDYWEAIESTNFFMGGAIWDWIDQAMYYYDKNTGERFLAYGGDFGDKPNDGTFVNNGLIFADMKPKPQYYEVKKVYQNVAVTAINMQAGKIELFNKNYFKDLSEYNARWSLYKDGVEVEGSGGILPASELPGPRQRRQIVLPIGYEKLDAGSEYFIKVQFLLKENSAWADKGYVQMEEQLFVKAAQNKPSMATVAKGSTPVLNKEGDLQVIKGEQFVAKFDNKTGTIHSLLYGNKQIIREGEGPRLDVLRAPVDNDNWAYQQWFEKGLHNLKHKVLSADSYTRKDGALILTYTVESQAPYGASLLGGTSGTYSLKEHSDKPFGEDDFKFTSNQIWTIYKDGSIELSSSVTSNNASVVLARLGYSLQLPGEYHNYSYYGRGPINNYADRKTAQFIELHKSTVKDQFVPWPNPQSMSNNEDVRWAALTNDSGQGVLFVAKDRLSTSALEYSELELTFAPHPHQLPRSSGVHLHLDAAVTGLGGNSCGQGPPLEKDRVKAVPTSLGFLIRPVQQANLREQAHVAAAGDVPISITRASSGEVSVLSENAVEPIVYSVNNGKAKRYTAAFDLRQGGNVTAWYQGNEKLKVTQQYTKIETVPMEVVFASSQETGEGNAANLLDGDPSSIWHTMYSVTVAQYPHWVDFDAGSIKTIKGFTFLPRQDGSNGDIKDYKIQVSKDGKNWEDLMSASFERSKKLKTVRFENPVKGRYIRFTALSSQRGDDFASGAEFAVIAE
ncbi:glycoside hydrolase family 2 TIM barrel-domain containing protein [Sphingobacterium thalpophilum]|uniref:beta-galactosidase n=1 Tax=Sphingobacterium thalpophilum TaxID=259 RepID=A0A4U9UF63_9SPHI|nr:glycoside hydrolase family 2 TIM barrel-domain containing protein [Sphingobacterium thalpophilum]VTR31950.1 Evolved beta-galactosidase subunit alpha [Sphingobacterium thalpophilum]